MPAPTTQTTITESLSGSVRVDSDNGVIRGVKLIGFESKNRRACWNHAEKYLPLYPAHACRRMSDLDVPVFRSWGRGVVKARKK